VKKIQKSIEVH